MSPFPTGSAASAPRRPPMHELTLAPEAVRPYLESYGRMLLIRLFELEMHRLFLKGEVHGTTHLAAGQEAIAVGFCQTLEPEDYVAGTYRGHGHALAKGTDAEGMVAEMLGRATGTCGGRSGSMNVIDRAHGLVGCYGIVGGSIAAATGNALSGVVGAGGEATARPRWGGAPTLRESQPYRHYGHSKSDPAKYRPEGELERWKERDPLLVARQRLLEE